MNQFFQFEADFVESLHCIPMQVRYKLDTCGIKLKLHQWHQFGPAYRQLLVDRPCTTSEEIESYRDRLKQMIRETTQETAAELPIDPYPAWTEAASIPDSVIVKAEDVGVTITLPQWQSLLPLQRFALIKLSRSSHENRNFLPALKEFQLAGEIESSIQSQ